jgi:hypothetical protein
MGRRIVPAMPVFMEKPGEMNIYNKVLYIYIELIIKNKCCMLGEQ